MGLAIGKQLTDEKIKEIEKAYESGLYEKHVMALTGIARSTWYFWKKEANFIKEDLESGAINENELTSNQKILLEFIDVCEKGQVKVVKSCLDTIIQDDSWQSKAWYLERVDNESFGKKTAVQHSGSVGIIDVELTEEENEQFKANMASIGLNIGGDE